MEVGWAASNKAVAKPSTIPSAAASSDGPAMTPEQIRRERYLKGVKDRKCIVCGNQAQARCPFRACKTCCTMAKNDCTVHVYKPNKPRGAPVWNPRDPHRSASMGPPSMKPSSTPASGYANSSAMRAQVGYGTQHSGHNLSSARPWGAGGATPQQQELYRLKSVKAAMQAAQREAAMINTWRFQKLREHLAGETAIEDEAFDRYMHNMSLLEEVFSVTTSGGLSSQSDLIAEENAAQTQFEDRIGPDSLIPIDDILLREEMNADRRKGSQKRIKRTVEKRLQMLTREEQEMQDVMEDENLNQVGAAGGPRGSKRLKANTKDGKQCLERMYLFEALVQKTNQIQTTMDVDLCVDMYRQSFGHGLDSLLSRNVENFLRVDVKQKHDVDSVLVRTLDVQKEMKKPLLSKDQQTAMPTLLPDEVDRVATGQLNKSEGKDLEPEMEGKRLTISETKELSGKADRVPCLKSQEEVVMNPLLSKEQLARMDALLVDDRERVATGQVSENEEITHGVIDLDPEIEVQSLKMGEKDDGVPSADTTLESQEEVEKISLLPLISLQAMMDTPLTDERVTTGQMNGSEEVLKHLEQEIEGKRLTRDETEDHSGKGDCARSAESTLESQEEAKNALLFTDQRATIDTSLPDERERVATGQVNDEELVHERKDLKPEIEINRMRRDEKEDQQGDQAAPGHESTLEPHETKAKLLSKNQQATTDSSLVDERERVARQVTESEVALQAEDLELKSEGKRLAGYETENQKEKGVWVPSAAGSSGLSITEAIITMESKQQDAGKRHWSHSLEGFSYRSRLVEGRL